MAKNIKDAEEKLGKSKVEEIIEKEWKVVDPPTEEELAAAPKKHPKTRNNPNSRKNLMQYRKKSPEQKEKMVKNLKFVENEEDIDPREVLGEFTAVEAIEKLFPATGILQNRAEQEIYYTYLKLMLKDFINDELTASDIDDIITLAVNRVLENRLLQAAQMNKGKMLMEAMGSIQKLRQSSEKIKGALASRRVDRVDLKSRPAMSIVNLVEQLDAQEKADMDQRLKDMEKERKTFVAPKRDEDGFLIED
jgi:hypothetical protein